MSLNVSKSKYIIFHVPSKTVDPAITLVIDENLPNVPHNPSRVTTVERMHSKYPDHDSQALKLLGIYLDEHLNFNHNTAKLTSKLSRACFFINCTLACSILTYYTAPMSTHTHHKPTSLQFSNNQKKLSISLLEPTS